MFSPSNEFRPWSGGTISIERSTHNRWNKVQPILALLVQLFSHMNSTQLSFSGKNDEIVWRRRKSILYANCTGGKVSIVAIICSTPEKIKRRTKVREKISEATRNMLDSPSMLGLHTHDEDQERREAPPIVLCVYIGRTRTLKSRSFVTCLRASTCVTISLFPYLRTSIFPHLCTMMRLHVRSSCQRSIKSIKISPGGARDSSQKQAHHRLIRYYFHVMPRMPGGY